MLEAVSKDRHFCLFIPVVDALTHDEIDHVFSGAVVYQNLIYCIVPNAVPLTDAIPERVVDVGDMLQLGSVNPAGIFIASTLGDVLQCAPGHVAAKALNKPLSCFF